MKYKQTQLFEHPFYTDISWLRTVCFISVKKSPNIFLKFKPLNTDTSHGHLSDRVIKQGVTVILIV